LPEIMRAVRQRRTIEVQLVDASQLERAAKLVRPLLEADSSVSLSPTEAMLRFETSHSETKLAEILAALVREGLLFSQFRELQADLEDTFLTITRETAAAENRAALAGAGSAGP
jgi:hypothetical protein